MVTPDLCLSAAHYLKNHTSAQHQALESLVLPRLQSLKSLADYTQLLLKFYGYYKPVEDGIAAHLDVTDLPDLPQRRNARLILEDLTFSNPHTQDIPLASTLPTITNKAEAFGALYVLEGSTLGGRGITKLLLKNNALNLGEHQVRFFNGYGAATGPMWISFIERLNAYGNNETVLQQMAAAANETFYYFKIWLQQK
jgi:heme oxygenase (biliverdin-IX-beta and delta-forming)